MWNRWFDLFIRHFFKSTAVANLKFISVKSFFLHTCATCSGLRVTPCYKTFSLFCLYKKVLFRKYRKRKLVSLSLSLSGKIYPYDVKFIKVNSFFTRKLKRLILVIRFSMCFSRPDQILDRSFFIDLVMRRNQREFNIQNTCRKILIYLNFPTFQLSF